MIESTVVGEMPGVVMSRVGDRLLKGARGVVRRVTDQTKAMARAQIATKLTTRAAFTITSEFYEDDIAGYIHSRWFRGPRGKVRNTGSLGAMDVLAIHERGGVIRPARGRYLWVPLNEGRSYTAREHKRRLAANKEYFRSFGVAKNRYGVRKYEFKKLSGDRILVVEKTGSLKGEPIAIMVRQVKIPKRLDFAEVKRRAFVEMGLAVRGVVLQP